MAGHSKKRAKQLQNLKIPTPPRPVEKTSFFFTSEFIIAISFVFCFFLSSIYLKRYFFILDLKNQEQELILQVESLEKSNLDLKKEVEYLQSLEGVESLARSRLGMVKPGEQIIRPVLKKNLEPKE